MLGRRLHLPERPTNSFFLWGPRQTGKSTLLRAAYAGAVWVDLLKSDEFARYAERPALLREELDESQDESLIKCVSSGKGRSHEGDPTRVSAGDFCP